MMHLGIIWFLLFSTFTAATSRKLTNKELNSLPKLFHLDEYHGCLASRGGLYCVGTFELTANHPNPILDLIKEHKSEDLSFNRTLLRRGYCVNQRCPHENNEKNATLRFERCVAKHTRRYSLVPVLRKLHYCTTHEHRQKASRQLNKGQKIFLYSVAVILLFNVAGTLYHYYMGNKSNKNDLLMAWSVPSNWARLTSVSNSEVSALAPLQCFRIVIQSITIFAHSALAHHLVYTENPEFLEKIPHTLMGSMLRNGLSLVQIFFLVSSFLTGYNLLNIAQKTGVSVNILFKLILKRLARILPVYLLVVGYVMTWWPQSGDSALWSIITEKESEICYRKFWTQVFFVSNLVEPSEMCLLQTWSLSVDMQLYILSTLLTLLLIRLKVRAARILAVLYVASGVFNVVLSYVCEWGPAIKSLFPENLRHMFRYTPSFPYIHQSPWSNMPACFLGLFMAHLFFEKTKKKEKIEDKPEDIDKQENNGKKVTKERSNKAVKNIAISLIRRRDIKNPLYHNADYLAIAGLMLWSVLAAPIEKSQSRLLDALYVGLERMVFSLLFGALLTHLITVDSGLRRFSTWSGWHVCGRLMFAGIMVHWSVNLFIVIGRSQAIVSSEYSVSMDFIATVIFSNLIALPVCLLVELPAQKFLDLLISVPRYS